MLAALGLFAFGGQDIQRAHVRQMNELVALSQKIPSQAAALAAQSAFDALAKSRARYSKLANRSARKRRFFAGSDRAAETDPDHPGFARSHARVHKAATEVRALMPQLMQSLGNVVSALGSTGVEGMTRHLERFELTGLRLQQDMEGLAGGVSDATVDRAPPGRWHGLYGPGRRRPGGEDTGLGLPKVTGAASARAAQVYHARCTRS